MKRFAFLFLLSATLIFISSCDKCNDDAVFCTEEFRMITINIDNSTQLPVMLDEAYTLRQGSSQKLLFDQPFTNGTYVVLDDSYHPNLKNDEDVFRFIGVKNGVVIIDTPYSIAGDNCHIFKKTGVDSVVIQP